MVNQQLESLLKKSTSWSKCCGAVNELYYFNNEMINLEFIENDPLLTYTDSNLSPLRGVEWVHDLFLFPLVLGKMLLPHAKLGLFCVV